MLQMSMTHGCCVYKHPSYGRTQVVFAINSDQRKEVVLSPILTLRSIYTRNRRSDCLWPLLYEKGSSHPFMKNKDFLLLYQYK